MSSTELSAPRFDLGGSPADKADLEVGDEILEVNGKSLEDATHTEVISHIHQVSYTHYCSHPVAWAPLIFNLIQSHDSLATGGPDRPVTHSACTLMRVVHRTFGQSGTILAVYTGRLDQVVYRTFGQSGTIIADIHVSFGPEPSTLGPNSVGWLIVFTFFASFFPARIRLTPLSAFPPLVPLLPKVTPLLLPPLPFLTSATLSIFFTLR
uniref:PDZ domain-containing protein n=1 Tax=Timema poppense TaxID=170557 RepID=A0A7R9H6E0_TIMPO|nr:unnamed protein product [Timema poppensis]